MPQLFASLVNGQFLLGRARALPCIDTPDEIIDGFDEIDVTIENIKDPEVKKKLTTLAKRIVASHKTPNRIIGFEVHGHADVDLRTPAGSKREEIELQVSKDRGANARDLLLSRIEEEGGKGIIAGIRANSSSMGLGSKCRKIIPARTPQEMKRNRRVEIFLKEVRFQPQPPEPPEPPRPKPPELGTNWRIKINRGTVTSVNSPVGDILAVARISLDITITDVDRKQKAEFVATGEGLTISGTVGGSTLPLGTTISHVGKGPEQSFRTVQGVALGNFPGDLTLAQNLGVSVSVLSFHGEFAMSFDALAAPTRPKVVEVEGGNDPFGVPQGGVIAPGHGNLEMKGSPVSAP